MKISELFKDSQGRMSSKRLGYLSTVPVSSFGTLWICYLLIKSSNPAMAVQVWTSYLIFSAVLGGFVSAELIPTILLAVRGISNKKKKDEKTTN